MVRFPQISQNQHAVVLGAGLEGLLSARALTEYFQYVTLVTAGTLPTEASLPQHLAEALPMHLLSVQGYRNLERLFPGLTAELMTAGAPTVEWTADAAVRLPGGWAPRFHSDLISRPVTLSLLCRVLRQRLLDYSGGRVAFLESREVAGIDRDPHQRGLRLALRGASTGEIVPADLVVHTADAPAAAEHWLERAGCPLPTRTMIGTRAGLAARLYRRPVDVQPGWQALLIVDQPGGVLMPVENGRWLVMLTTEDGVPRNEADFMALARSLPTPALADAIRQALPLTPVLTQPHAQALRWQYGDLDDAVDGLLRTGGALAAFLPVMGFDLTLTTLSALALREVLEEQRKQQPNGSLAGLQRRLFNRLERQCALPWSMLSADGTDQSVARLVCQYRPHVLAAAQSDASIWHDLIAAAGLVAPMWTLIKPGMLRRMLQSPEAPRSVPLMPPVFEAMYAHKTITQEIAAVARMDES